MLHGPYVGILGYVVGRITQRYKELFATMNKRPPLRPFHFKWDPYRVLRDASGEGGHSTAINCVNPLTLYGGGLPSIRPLRSA